jgi:hypothetical protein
MKKQPDFTKLFREYFGNTPKRVTYTLRQEPNRLHDLVFLLSLIHDARFQRKDIVLRGKRLILPIERDCWELGLGDHAASMELYVARSRLIVSPVTAIRWSLCQDATVAPDDELWIDHVWLDDRSKNVVDRLIISGSTWDCTITGPEDDLTVRLEDVETPYLYSERHKGRGASS